MNDIVQEKYFEFQMLQQQAEQLRQQQGLVDHQLSELTVLRDALSGVHTAKKNSEMLVPLGVGVFLRSSLQNTDEVVMNVGAKLAVVKSLKDAQVIVEKQVEEARKVVEELQQHSLQFNARLQALQEELQVLVAEQQQKHDKHDGHDHKDHKH